MVLHIKSRLQMKLIFCIFQLTSTKNKLGSPDSFMLANYLLQTRVSDSLYKYLASVSEWSGSSAALDHFSPPAPFSSNHTIFFKLWLPLPLMWCTGMIYEVEAEETELVELIDTYSQTYHSKLPNLQPGQKKEYRSSCLSSFWVYIHCFSITTHI